MSRFLYPRKVISGGQTGVDRTALEVAKAVGIQTGGTAPRGWRTEHGPSPDLADFGLVEGRTSSYPDRTLKNVYDATGTVWFGDPTSAGGTLTLDCCYYVGRPYLVNPSASALRRWLDEHCIEVLNVAGNRASKNPEAGMTAAAVLRAVLGE